MSEETEELRTQKLERMMTEIAKKRTPVGNIVIIAIGGVVIGVSVSKFITPLVVSGITNLGASSGFASTIGGITTVAGGVAGMIGTSRAIELFNVANGLQESMEVLLNTTREMQNVVENVVDSTEFQHENLGRINAILQGIIGAQNEKPEPAPVAPQPAAPAAPIVGNA